MNDIDKNYIYNIIENLYSIFGEVIPLQRYDRYTSNFYLRKPFHKFISELELNNFKILINKKLKIDIDSHNLVTIYQIAKHIKHLNRF